MHVVNLGDLVRLRSYVQLQRDGTEKMEQGPIGIVIFINKTQIFERMLDMQTVEILWDLDNAVHTEYVDELEVINGHR